MVYIEPSESFKTKKDFVKLCRFAKEYLSKDTDDEVVICINPNLVYKYFPKKSVLKGGTSNKIDPEYIKGYLRLDNGETMPILHLLPDAREKIAILPSSSLLVCRR